MISIAHIVNPVVVPASSDLYRAQPITFESMRRARSRIEHSPLVRVSLLSAQYPEDRPQVPGDFRMTPDLDRSILDRYPGIDHRKLPLVEDILQRLYADSDADYFIYTNVDIGLSENFYNRVAEIIEEGYDAFSITRRTIPDHFSSVDQLPQIYLEKGLKHPGWDCFVFRRNLVPSFRHGDLCLGVPPVGRVMLCNCQRFASRFHLFDDEHVTFHIGNDGEWKGKRSEVQIMNTRNGLEIIRSLVRSSTDPEDRAQLSQHAEMVAENLRRITNENPPGV